MAGDIEAQLAEQDEQTKAARQGGLAGAIPMAKEPLKPAMLNAVGQLLSSAVETLSGGQAPPVELESVQGPVDQVPPDLGAQILALGAFVERAASKVPALEPYKFDPISSMETNAGLAELQGVIQGITSDRKVIGALQGPAPATEEEPEPAPVMD
jgi:hypothetical protein